MPLRCAALFAALVLFATPALAGSVIEVMHPWSRPTIPNRPGVAYLGIHNVGDAVDRLVGARADHVGSVEIHQAMQSGGVMSMTPVDSVTIDPGGMVDLEPGGYHLMLFDIDQPLRDGDTLNLTLIFELAGEIPVTVPVSKAAGAPAHHGDGHGSHSGHKTTGN